MPKNDTFDELESNLHDTDKISVGSDGPASSFEDIRGVDGAQGAATLSGDGTTTSFTIAHGLPEAPDWADVVPRSVDASADHRVTWDDTNITVSYETAPESGSGNLEYYWNATLGAGANLADVNHSHDGDTLTPFSVDVEEVLLTEYAAAGDAPAGSGVGIVGVTSDGHLLLEDGN